MQHLDEGRIHAYLDSELSGDEREAVELHLAACASCRERLQAEREIKESAAAILQAAAPPSLDIPPFSQVQERSEQIHEQRRRGLSRGTKLAWAATVVLALGIGWYARELAVDRQRVREVAVLEPIEARPATPQPAAPAAAEEPAPATEREPIATPPAQLPAAGLAPPAAGRTPEIAAETRPEIAAETRKDLRALAALAVESVPAAEAAPAGDQTRSATGWTEVDQEEAERRLNGPLAGIPGARTISIRAGRRDGITVVRSLQVLESGVTVELEQAPSPGGVPAAPRQREPVAAPGFGSQGVSTLWNGFLVVGRGPLPADSLMALLGRLQRAQPPEPD
ncbi:MAG: hypothetical protein KatS3mg081_2775 [Gemmatimonadales bacterium]|nr:MAG: hypothetical protein KatS3mg081_2775 [Gemmatimonadales bacterium]